MSDDPGLIVPFVVSEGIKLTSPFGMRNDPGNVSKVANHNGVDFGMPVGTPLYAPSDGIVHESILSGGSSGRYIVIYHPPMNSSGLGSWRTAFAHLSKSLVTKGQSVSKGQLIGLSGGAKGSEGAGSSQGPHLHFTVKKLVDGKHVTVDPLQYLKIKTPIPVKSTLAKSFGDELAKNTSNWKTPVIIASSVVSVFALYKIFSR